MGINNCALDIVGCEKIAKAITVVLEANPDHVLLLPDIINAFNSIRRKLSLERLMEEVPEMTPALRYSYQIFAALIESVDQLDDQDSMGESQTGFTQGDPAASAGFSLNHAKFLNSQKPILILFLSQNASINSH
jgi:hypothetical protein